MFTPDMDVNNWKLIIARIDVNFLAEIYYGQDAHVLSWLIKLGRSSMTIRQEVWQGGECKARGDAVMIHYDYSARQSVTIPANIRLELEKVIDSE